MSAPDTRPLYIRVAALAGRFDAIAIGAEKRLRAGDRSVSVQDVTNAQRDAATLHEAVELLEGRP